MGIVLVNFENKKTEISLDSIFPVLWSIPEVELFNSAQDCIFVRFILNWYKYAFIQKYYGASNLTKVAVVPLLTVAP